MTDASREIETLRAALQAAEARAAAAEAEAAEAARDRAVLASAEAMIAALKLEIEKLKRTLYGVRSERKARLLDQLELQLEELEAAATEDAIAAERAAAQGEWSAPLPLDKDGSWELTGAGLSEEESPCREDIAVTASSSSARWSPSITRARRCMALPSATTSAAI